MPDIDVIPPDTSAKLAIANNANADSSMPDTVLALLETIESGLEAWLVGESVLSVSPGASCYGVFDAFCAQASWR